MAHRRGEHPTPPAMKRLACSEPSGPTLAGCEQAARQVMATAARLVDAELAAAREAVAADGRSRFFAVEPGGVEVVELAGGVECRVTQRVAVWDPQRSAPEGVDERWQVVQLDAQEEHGDSGGYST